MQGTFIVLEGPDGSGTSKHSGLLAERCRSNNQTVLLTAEPTSGDIGVMTRTLLEGADVPQSDVTQLLFCADRAEHVQKEILPALERGATVICDRYALSTILYGTALGLDRDWLTNINSIFPQPDMTLITLPPFDVCVERMHKRDTHDQYEHHDFQRTVYDLYAQYEAEHVVHVDTSGEVDEVAEEVWNYVQK